MAIAKAELDSALEDLKGTEKFSDGILFSGGFDFWFG